MRASLSMVKTGLAASLIALGLGLPAGAPAQEPAAASFIRDFEVSAASGPIKIDGALDEAAWADATVIDLPYEWFPGDNVKPPVATQALVTFDGENLYVAFKAQDPSPSEIRANLMDRDAVNTFIQDDHVGFNLDTFNDERRAFQFRVNPVGVQVDAVFSEIDSADDFAWDAIWASEGRITAEGYVVEIAIPFRQIRFPRTQGPQTWGIELFRSYPRSVRHRISSRLTDRAKDCILCQENKITGIQGIAPGRNLEITPTVTIARTDSLETFPDGGLQQGDEEYDPGVTARWGVTPNMTLNATINPDFSQVEADVAQLDINTRFALFFPEKRPFFLEGADLYLTPLAAVFTRTVADPSWGVKLNAKEDRDAYGLFVARDDITNILIPSNQRSLQASLDESVLEGVFRYRRDIGARSALGVLYTGREGQDEGKYHNRVGGLDGFFRFTDSDTVRLQYLASDTLYHERLAAALGDEAKPFSGDALSVQYDHFAQVWKGFLRYVDLDPQFRADSGFIPRVDVKTAEGQYQRFFYGTKDTWYAQASAGVRGLRTEDHDGRLTDQNMVLFGNVNGPLQSIVEVNLQHNKELFDGVTFDLDRQALFFQFSPAGRLRLSLLGRFGDEIDVANTRLGETTELESSMQLRLGRHLDLQLDYVIQQLDVDGGQLFDARLAQSRIIYQFNVRTFVRAILQYQDLSRNADLYLAPVEPEQKELFGQFLFSYKLNPQTVLFLGYTDGRFGFQDIDLTQTDRTFFVKLGYALLF